MFGIFKSVGRLGIASVYFILWLTQQSHFRKWILHIFIQTSIGKTACLSVNAGAINEEDYYNLVEEGIIELSDEEDVRAQTKIQYGKVASAISNFRGQIEIQLPDINTSRLGFTPDAEK